MKASIASILVIDLAFGLPALAAGSDPVAVAPAPAPEQTNSVLSLKPDHEVNFVVVPGPTYSPSLGWGLMLIPMATFKYDPADQVSPASSLAAFMMFTENGSYVAGIGPKLYLCEDTWRISGGAGYANIKQKFFGIGGTVDSGDYVSMTSDTIMAKGQVLYRAWPNIYLGPSLQYSQVRFRGDDPAAEQVLKEAGLNSDYNHNFSPGLVGQFDTRDDQTAPGKGILVDLNVRYSSEALGSTSSFERMGAAYSQYVTLWDDPRHVLAWQATVETGFGDVPFDEYPDLGGQKALRGYVKGEFTDKNMAAIQAEYRWNAWKRLGFTAFGGTGKVFPAWNEIDDARWLSAGGVGLRYLVIPERRMNARLDLAWGELGFNFYFSVGEAF